MISQSQLEQGLNSAPAYFKVQAGKYADSIAHVELEGRPGGIEVIRIIYTPTWPSQRTVSDLREETWFSGESIFEDLHAYLEEANAVLVPGEAIPNWTSYFEDLPRRSFTDVNYKNGDEIAFAIGSFHIEEFFRELTSGALDTGRKMGFRSLRALLWAKKITTNLDFTLALSAHLKLRGFGLALVPLNAKTIVHEETRKEHK